MPPCPLVASRAALPRRFFSRACSPLRIAVPRGTETADDCHQQRAIPYSPPSSSSAQLSVTYPLPFDPCFPRANITNTPKRDGGREESHSLAAPKYPALLVFLLAVVFHNHHRAAAYQSIQTFSSPADAHKSPVTSRR
uniref:Uncharacterized protein n=1 Tax=Oryza glumipatula TaxID=40148 RepID=A0A0D9Y7I0_9ORYZ